MKTRKTFLNFWKLNCVCCGLRPKPFPVSGVATNYIFIRLYIGDTLVIHNQHTLQGGRWGMPRLRPGESYENRSSVKWVTGNIEADRLLPFCRCAFTVAPYIDYSTKPQAWSLNTCRHLLTSLMESSDEYHDDQVTSCNKRDILMIE